MSIITAIAIIEPDDGQPSWPLKEVIPITVEDMEMIERMWKMPSKESEG